jgi:hypothetical protein
MNLCSLRQHDLDQVLRVERGSLLSVPHRGTPRSVVTTVIKLVDYFVNTNIILPCASTPPSSEVQWDLHLNRVRGNL